MTSYFPSDDLLREVALVSLAEKLGLTPFEAVFAPATFDRVADVLGFGRLVEELLDNENLRSYLGVVIRKVAADYDGDPKELGLAPESVATRVVQAQESLNEAKTPPLPFPGRKS